MSDKRRQQEFEQLVARTSIALSLPYQPVVGTALEQHDEAGVWYITLHNKSKPSSPYIQLRVESESTEVANLGEPVRTALLGFKPDE